MTLFALDVSVPYSRRWKLARMHEGLVYSIEQIYVWDKMLCCVYVPLKIIIHWVQFVCMMQGLLSFSNGSVDCQIIIIRFLRFMCLEESEMVHYVQLSSPFDLWDDRMIWSTCVCLAMAKWHAWLLFCRLIHCLSEQQLPPTFEYEH